MAISNIVCRGGVGPTATIGLFVTHGLGAGGIPPSATSSGNHKKRGQAGIMKGRLGVGGQHGR